MRRAVRLYAHAGTEQRDRARLRLAHIVAETGADLPVHGATVLALPYLVRCPVLTVPGSVAATDGRA